MLKPTFALLVDLIKVRGYNLTTANATTTKTKFTSQVKSLVLFGFGFTASTQ